MNSLCASAPVILDKLELVSREFVDRSDPRFCWDWVVENWSLVARFDLAVDVPAKIAGVFRSLRPRVKLQRWDVADTRGFRTRYYGAPDADLRLRVYDRDWDALFPTGLIRLEWQLRGRRARRYLQSAFNGSAFGAPFSTPGDVYSALAELWFDRFPVCVADGAGLSVLGGELRPHRDVWRIRTIESCLKKLDHLSPGQVAGIVASLADAWARSGGDGDILKNGLDIFRASLNDGFNKPDVQSGNTLF